MRPDATMKLRVLIGKAATHFNYTTCIEHIDHRHRPFVSATVFTVLNFYMLLQRQTSQLRNSTRTAVYI